MHLIAVWILADTVTQSVNTLSATGCLQEEDIDESKPYDLIHTTIEKVTIEDEGEDEGRGDHRKAEGTSLRLR